MRNLAFASILLFSRFAFASLIGNPSDPAVLEEGFWISDCCWSSARAGVAGDFLFSKRLKPCRMMKGLGISRPEMNYTAAIADVGWNIREKFDLHLMAGPATSSHFQWHQRGVFYRTTSNEGLYWAGSAKLVVLEMKDTTLGVDCQGGGIEWMKGPLLQNGIPDAKKANSRLYFWQIAAGLSQNVGTLKPYLGAAVNQFSSITRMDGMKKMRFHDLVHVGTYEGCTISIGSKIFLNVEARQFFETALALTGELRF